MKKSVRSSTANERAVENLLDSIASDIARGRHYGASLSISRGGERLLTAELGTVAAGGRDIDTEDVYFLASVSKAFTAALVLQAVDAGRLSLDTRVADVLPYFGVRGKSRVTVAHLLTHRGGTYASFAPLPPLGMRRGEVGDLERNARGVSALPAAFTPGERVVYNPFAGYAVLAQMLVELDGAGRSFRQIAREELFEPLGMADTSFGYPVGHPRRVPISVPPSDTLVTDSSVMEALNEAIDEDSEVPAGAAFATLEDVTTFAEACRRQALGERVFLSPSLFAFGAQIQTGDLGNGFWDFDREVRGIPPFPANFTLLGGYGRGRGHHLTPFGLTASPHTFGAVGGGTTLLMVDPERDTSFVFLSSGFMEGLEHFQRLQRIADLALATL